MDNNDMFNQNPQPEQQSQFQQSYQQAPYQQPPYQQPYQPMGELEEPVSFGEWMLTLLLMCIPCVNIILMFVWAFGKSAKKSMANYFKATLAWMAIWIVICILISVIAGASVASIIGASYY